MAHVRLRASVTVGNQQIRKLYPGIVVFVLTGSRKLRDRWYKIRRQLGLGCDVCQSFGRPRDTRDPAVGEVTAYEVWGAPDALAELTDGEHSIILHWEYPQTGGHVVCAGAGDLENAQRKRRTAQRMAADEASKNAVGELPGIGQK